MKLEDIPLTVSTLPVEIGYKEAVSAQRWLFKQYGIVSTVWRIGSGVEGVPDKWVLQTDELPPGCSGKYQMVELWSTYRIWFELGVDPLD